MVTETQNQELVTLLRMAQAGDQAAYARFLQAITPIITRMVKNRVGDGDRDDVVQEILVSVHKARHTHDGMRPVMPWLASIARFRMTDHMRKHYAARDHLMSDISEMENTLADVTESHRQNESIADLLHQVPEREKQILTLMHVEGYTAKQVGEKLSMGESAVKVAAHRAIKKIRALREEQ